jgi:hypothetical protein
MKDWIVSLALFLCAFCGCGRKEEVAAPQPTAEQAAQIESQYLLPPNDSTPAQAASPSPVSRAPNAQQPARPVQERLQGAIHAQLTVQLRMFIEKNGRVPETFSEFANSAMDSVPLAPEGMKFVIDPTDRTVKAAKK